MRKDLQKEVGAEAIVLSPEKIKEKNPTLDLVVEIVHMGDGNLEDINMNAKVLWVTIIISTKCKIQEKEVLAGAKKVERPHLEEREAGIKDEEAEAKEMNRSLSTGTVEEDILVERDRMKVLNPVIVNTIAIAGEGTGEEVARKIIIIIEGREVKVDIVDLLKAIQVRRAADMVRLIITKEEALIDLIGAVIVQKADKKDLNIIRSNTLLAILILILRKK